MFSLIYQICLSVLLFFFFFQAEDGIRDIGVTGVQTCALPIFTIHELCTDSIKVRSLLAFTNPLMQFCIYTMTVLLLFFASYRITLPQEDNFNIGQLSSLLIYSLMILNSFMALSMVFVMISMSVESGKRITEVLIEKNLLSNPENPIF